MQEPRQTMKSRQLCRVFKPIRTRVAFLSVEKGR